MPYKDEARNQECRKRTTAKWIAKNPIKYWAAVTHSNARKRAISKGVPFALKVADIERLAVPVCPALGLRLQYGKGTGISDSSPALDRIEPAKGYVVGNLWVLSHQANNIKSNATPDQIYAVCGAVAAKLHENAQKRSADNGQADISNAEEHA